MIKNYNQFLSVLYSAGFIGFCLFILLDHKARFWIELDLAPFIPWLQSHSLIGLITLLGFMGFGSYFDRLLQMDGAKAHPTVAIILAAILLCIFCLLFAIFITSTYYTYAHEKFYITAGIVLLAGGLLWQWARTRLI